MQGREDEARRRPFISRWSAVLVFLLLLLLTREVWLKGMGEFLIERNELEAADAIVVLAGGGNTRIDRGIELFRAGYGSVMILTSGPGPLDIPLYHKTLGELNRDWALAEGVPVERMRLTRLTTSTFDDALATAEIAGAEGFDSLLVVTDVYHSRRAAWDFRRVLGARGVKVISSPSVPSWYGEGHWWENPGGAVRIVNEYIKMPYDVVQLFSGPPPRP